jgi:hypothetical protein
VELDLGQISLQRCQVRGEVEDVVSCSFVIVGRLYDDQAVGRPNVEVRASVAAVEGGAVCGVVAGGAAAMKAGGDCEEELMVAGGSKGSGTKLVGLRILPGISLSL